NYVEGLQTVASGKYDVTLIDYRIDTGTGLEFIRMMRARNIDCPAILLTGVRSREVDVAAQQAGASDYLIKGSLNSEILERSIRYAIAHSDRRRVLDSVLANIDAGVIALDASDGVMMMNAMARTLVGLDDVGQYAPDNSIGIFSNVRRFLGEAPYPASVFDAKGQEYTLKSTPLVNNGKLIVLREATRQSAANVAQPVSGESDGEPQGLTPAATHSLYAWMDKVLNASKQLTTMKGASSWQQFAAELRHSGRRLVHDVNELQKLGPNTPAAARQPGQATQPGQAQQPAQAPQTEAPQSSPQRLAAAAGARR
ncbi:MAG: response regulator, partial [Methyloligellaceae bacterium]